MKISYFFIMTFTLFGFILSMFGNDKILQSDDEPKTCTAHVVSFYQNTKLDLFMDFVGARSEKKGSVFLYGTYQENNEIKGYVRREVKYEWKEDANNFYFTGVSINKESERHSLSDATLRNLIPDFYITPKSQIYFKIKKMDDEGWFFYVGKRPVLFCSVS